MSKIWLLRSPGGMLKVLISDVLLTQDQAKQTYIDHMKEKWKKADFVADPEARWPTCTALTEHELNTTWKHLLEPSQVTSKQRFVLSLIEVEEGKIKPTRKAGGSAAEPAKSTGKIPTTEKVVES